MKKTLKFLETVKANADCDSVFVEAEECQHEIQSIKDEIKRLHSVFEENQEVGFCVAVDGCLQIIEDFDKWKEKTRPK